MNEAGSHSAWETGYSHAEAYFLEHPSVSPTVAHRSPDGFPVGRWIAEQRSRRSGYLSQFRGDRLTAAQIQRLDAIGMVWTTRPFGPWLLADERPDLAAHYADDLNAVPFGQVRFRTNRAVSWRCANGHVWQEAPSALAERKTPGCPVCGDCPALPSP